MPDRKIYKEKLRILTENHLFDIAVVTSLFPAIRNDSDVQIDHLNLININFINGQEDDIEIMSRDSSILKLGKEREEKRTLHSFFISLFITTLRFFYDLFLDSRAFKKAT
uniref:Uncharacterized protein n=1 Tax=Onchocerca volvulus TaxID=6282 RepID=A0A8R1TLW9_ONCVO